MKYWLILLFLSPITVPAETLTKDDIVARVIEETGLDHEQVVATVDSFLENIVTGLVAGDRVAIRELGVFRVQHRQARTGRNPSTGDSVSVPARNIPRFNASSSLKERVAASAAQEPTEDQ